MPPTFVNPVEKGGDKTIVMNDEEDDITEMSSDLEDQEKVPPVVYTTAKVLTETQSQTMNYFDPLDAVKPTMGEIFHFEMSTTPWLDQLDDNPEDEIDAFLASLSQDELSGRELPFDIHGYVVNARAQVVHAKHKELTEADIRWMSKWLMRPLDVMKETLTCTTRRLKAYFR